MALREKRDGDKCKKHPRFTGKVEPKPTGMYKNGCPTCWEIYDEKQKALVVKETPKKKSKPVQSEKFIEERKKYQFTSETSPGGKPTGTMKEYIESRTSKGKKIVDAMMEIAGLRFPKGVAKKDRPRFQTKDRITALKWLAANGFDVEGEDGDKTRPIQIVNYGELYVGPRPPS